MVFSISPRRTRELHELPEVLFSERDPETEVDYEEKDDKIFIDFLRAGTFIFSLMHLSWC